MHSFNSTVVRPDGKAVTALICVHTRGGSKSDKLVMIHYRGKRLTPYEQRIRGWSWSLNMLFKITYGEALRSLITESNPFMNLVGK